MRSMAVAPDYRIGDSNSPAADRAISLSIGDTSGKTQPSAATPPVLKGE